MPAIAKRDTLQRDRFVWIFLCSNNKEMKANKRFAGLQSYISE
jgi:hypothetical protein